MTNEEKYSIADKVAGALQNHPAFESFADESKKEQYYKLFHAKVSKGKTLLELYDEDDALHICGLVRHRLTNTLDIEIDIDL